MKKYFQYIIWTSTILLPLVFVFGVSQYLRIYSSEIPLYMFDYIAYGTIIFTFVSFLFSSQYTIRRLNEKYPDVKSPILSVFTNNKGSNWRRKIFQWIAAIILAIVFIMASQVIDSMAWAKQWSGIFLIALGVFMAPIVGIFQAFAEELFFRKWMIRLVESRLKGRYSTIIAVILSAIVFSASHMQWDYFFPIFVLWIVLGSIYVVFRSVKLNFFIHAVNNVIGIIFIVGSSPMMHTLSDTSYHPISSQIGVMERYMTLQYLETNNLWKEMGAENISKESDAMSILGWRFLAKYAASYDVGFSNLEENREISGTGELLSILDEKERNFLQLPRPEKTDAIATKIYDIAEENLESNINLVKPIPKKSLRKLLKNE